MTTTPADNTPYGIITDAMRSAGLLKRGQDPSGEDLSEYMRRLRDIINAMMTQGLKLFLWQDTSVPLTSGTQAYTLQPGGTVDMTKPLRVISAYFLDSSSTVTPLRVISWNEWVTLSNKTDTGALNQIFVDKQATYLKVYCYLIPDSTAATGTLHVILQTQATRPVTLTETMAFPPEWRIALCWALAAEICTGQPVEVIARCERKAAQYTAALEDWDVEDTATQFTPDTQMGYSTNSFR